MYILPLVVMLLICLAIFFSPIFAVILFVLFVVGLGFYKFLGRGTDPEHAPPNAPGAATVTSSSEEEDTGASGETWPEQSQSEKPS
jgi:hypothetical protein